MQRPPSLFRVYQRDIILTSNQLLFYLEIRTRKSLCLRSVRSVYDSKFTVFSISSTDEYSDEYYSCNGVYTRRGFILSYYSCRTVSLHRRPRDLLIPILGTARYSVHFNSCNYRFWTYIAQVPTYTRIILKLLRLIDGNAAFAYSDSYRWFHTRDITR